MPVIYTYSEDGELIERHEISVEPGAPRARAAPLPPPPPAEPAPAPSSHRECDLHLRAAHGSPLGNVTTGRRNVTAPRKSPAKQPAKPIPGVKMRHATVMRARFVEAYIRLGGVGHGAAAAIAAGYSEHRAKETGYALLRRPEIQAQIDRRWSEVRALAEEHTQVSVDSVLRELAALVHSDIRQVFDADGRVLPPSAWSDEIARSVSAVKLDDKGQVEQVRLWSKTESIDKAMKKLGLFELDNRQVGAGFAEQLQAALDRARIFDDASREPPPVVATVGKRVVQ